MSTAKNVPNPRDGTHDVGPGLVFGRIESERLAGKPWVRTTGADWTRDQLRSGQPRRQRSASRAAAAPEHPRARVQLVSSLARSSFFPFYPRSLLTYTLGAGCSSRLFSYSSPVLAWSAGPPRRLSAFNKLPLFLRFSTVPRRRAPSISSPSLLGGDALPKGPPVCQGHAQLLARPGHCE